MQGPESAGFRGAKRSAAVSVILVAVGLGSPVSARAAVSLPGPPPISRSAFPLESVGSTPVDNDGRIPAPATPLAPACTVTLVAPSDGDVSALQARIDADVAKGASFTGDTICLRGTFRAPIHVRSKISTARLTIASARSATAVFDLTGRPPQASDEDPGAHDNTDVGAIEIGGSRDVEVYGVTVRNWVTSDPALTPAGIYVTTTRADASVPVSASACYTSSADHVCSDIFLYNNTVQAVKNVAAGCGNLNIGAYGIAVKSFGNDASQALQHVVLEGNTVMSTLTGGSETVTVNGDVTDFLVAGNTIENVDNIGLDLIGWETGGSSLPGGHSASQARDGLISGNRIANVDTTPNLTGYGHLVNGKCVPGDDQAGGLYVDGGSYLWLDQNTLTETNHGIELGVEHSGRTADHLLVSSNTVSDSRGTTFSGTSYAGHAAAALIVGGVPQDGGSTSTVEDVYVHDNWFVNQSQFYNDGTANPTSGMTAPVVNVTGGWQALWLLGNTIEGGGASDKRNPLLVVDNAAGGQPTLVPGVVVDCERYSGLSTSPDAASADNFDTPPGNGFGLFGDYRAQNRMPTSEHGVTGWDVNGAANAAAACPFTLPDDASRTDGSTQVYLPMTESAAEPRPSAQNACYVPGGKLLFTRFTNGYNNDPNLPGSAGLYQIPTAGGAPTTVDFASGFSAVNMPGTCFSAAANRVASAWDLQDTDNIWTSSLTGTDPHRVTCITNANQHAQEPTWSSDGKTLVYELVDDNNPDVTTIWTVPATAGCGNFHPTKIVGVALACNSGKVPPTDNHQPAFSPDGKRIVLQSSAGENASTVNLWTVQPDGCGLTQITSGPNQDTDASFSPDSSKLVYSTNLRSSGPGFANLFIVPAVAGGVPTRLTSQCFLDGAPSWSPDGSWVSFETWPLRDPRNGENPTAIWRIPATARPSDPSC
jgi:TolB protein